VKPTSEARKSPTAAATENGKKFNLPLAYDREADQQSWAELQRFLRGLFAGP
jgi:hypothetical protein